jgi:hypothetical protein
MRRRFSVVLTAAVLGSCALIAFRTQAHDLFAPIRDQVVAERSALIRFGGNKLVIRNIYLRGRISPQMIQTLKPRLVQAGYKWQLDRMPDDGEWERPNGDSVQMYGSIICDQHEPSLFEELVGRFRRIGRDPYVDGWDDATVSRLLAR